ncbi:unnamed protein product [Bursaphelenchus xylophilus]|uniref:(pine wood nematode) hypothetical protein n=1 Tax=Bursaphelenchus xylophilus TaxID=6326 RepID=A0A1I7S7N6_BURXY|nr:unnamed protein product [Bursaphelenchus xylophilus]CAG9112035.1 unnamed protein product [Bursaphelenchus xylophilus]
MRWPFTLTFMGSSQESNPGTSEGPSTNYEADSNVLEEFNSLAFQNWDAEFASDPSEWERKFNSEWEKLIKKLQKPCKDVGTVTDVCAHVDSMCKLLVMEVNSLPMAAIGPILELVFTHDIFKLIVDWAEEIPIYLVPTCQVLLLRIYQGLVTRNHSQTHCLLVHKPILLPLLQILQWCRRSAEQRCFQRSRIDRDFVFLLHEICKKISVDSTLLDFFFNPRSTDGFDLYEKTQPFLVFNLLIRYLYDSDYEISFQCRNALLLILTASKDLDFVAKHVAEDSNFCPVLATGLSGCYSQLPFFICEALRLKDDEFHKLYIDADFDSVAELINFHGALLFCNAVVGAAHPLVAKNIVNYFYGGFLEEVVKPSLLQSDIDKLISRIAYFHLCLETVTEPAMIQTMLKLLSASETNVPDMNLLEVILYKMNQNDRLCRVVLSLLRTLLELRSEDFLWTALFRYILPFIRLKPQKSRFEPQLTVDAAKAFLSCIPECCLNIPELVSQDAFDAYNAEAYEFLRTTKRNCCQWKFKYDGVTPNNLLNLNIPEDNISGRQPFTRLSSARSSMASNAWNRYFTNRSNHGTSDSASLYAPDSGRFPLNQLGEDDFVSNLDTTYSDEEGRFKDLDLSNEEDPNEMFTSNYELMTQSHIDYFQFAYDGASESDGTSRKNSVKSEEKEEIKAMGTPLEPAKLELIKAINEKDWRELKENIPEFTSTLKSIPLTNKNLASQTVDEAMDLINARFQHVYELKNELEAIENERKLVGNPLKLDLNLSNNKNQPQGGLLMTCTTEKGAGYLYEALITCLERLVEHGITTNVQLALVFEVLTSYPQPVLETLVLYSDVMKTPFLPRIVRVLEKLKMQIDAFATSIDNFEEYVKRGAKHRSNLTNSYRRGMGSGRSTFRHTLIVKELSEADQQRTKHFAYAAIILSQICQLLAANALQHTPTYSVDG